MFKCSNFGLNLVVTLCTYKNKQKKINITSSINEIVIR